MCSSDIEDEPAPFINAYAGAEHRRGMLWMACEKLYGRTSAPQPALVLGSPPTVQKSLDDMSGHEVRSAVQFREHLREPLPSLLEACRREVRLVLH